MLKIGRTWPIPWTMAAVVLGATQSIDEALRRLERLEKQEGRRKAWHRSKQRSDIHGGRAATKGVILSRGDLNLEAVA